MATNDGKRVRPAACTLLLEVLLRETMRLTFDCLTMQLTVSATYVFVLDWCEGHHPVVGSCEETSSVLVQR